MKEGKMTQKPKILAFSGSLREHSFGKRVLKTAMKGAEKAGADVTFGDLRDYPMPIYNPDDEEENGFDDSARKFQALLAQHDGFLIASPEYNGSLSAALKNTADSWHYQRLYLCVLGWQRWTFLARKPKVRTRTTLYRR